MTETCMRACVHVRIMYRRVQFAWCGHWLTYCNYTAWFYTRPAGHIPLTRLFQTHLPTHLIPITDGVPVRCQIFLFNMKCFSLGVEGTQGVVVPGKAHRASLSQDGDLQHATFCYLKHNCNEPNYSLCRYRFKIIRWAAALSQFETAGQRSTWR
jgi:hypothetical protein